jgi:hypothetical protein
VPSRRSWQTGPVPSDAAELSSLTTTLREVEDRIAAIARHHEGTPRDDLLAALYEAERNLRAASRSLARAAALAG